MNNIDIFWDDYIKKTDEFINQKLEYELIPKNFNIPFAQCYDLYFNSIDNSKYIK